MEREKTFNVLIADAQAADKLGIDWSKLVDLYKLVVDVAPIAAPFLYATITRLLEILKRGPLVGALADYHCPDEHLHCCCCEALDSALETVVRLMACCECCDPRHKK